MLTIFNEFFSNFHFYSRRLLDATFSFFKQIARNLSHVKYQPCNAKTCTAVISLQKPQCFKEAIAQRSTKIFTEERSSSLNHCVIGILTEILAWSRLNGWVQWFATAKWHKGDFDKNQSLDDSLEVSMGTPTTLQLKCLQFPFIIMASQLLIRKLVRISLISPRIRLGIHRE